MLSPPRESDAASLDSQAPKYTMKQRVSGGKSGVPYLGLCSFQF